MADITRERFGSLTALEYAGTDGQQNARWRCVCDCGAQVVRSGRALRLGRSKHCGCGYGQAQRRAVHVTHGESGAREYGVWSRMHDRCRSPGNKDYRHYGGRGITVCERWTGPQGYEHFLADMGRAPDGLTLDRIDNDGNYEPGNCRWATRKQQRANQRPPTRAVQQVAS